ncbi:DUF1360 domain-containing protein [Streptomyces sp. NRRL B-1347]|uniref:DUF1360 domain-containing protein n=1 Tax=Streptomyces sp. NRRL B-1347 TaxID=1476877 RepID=UPI0004C67F7B|nr:DUF1360 domain-containing protein [Streptomyces sp. NRRL B-1347]
MIGPAEFALLAAASYRGTQLVVHDSILDPLRDRVAAWEDRADSRARTALLTLISCIYCSGWWVSGAVLATWLLATGQWHGVAPAVHAVEWFAVAGVQALLNRWDDSRDTAES